MGKLMNLSEVVALASSIIEKEGFTENFKHSLEMAVKQVREVYGSQIDFKGPPNHLTIRAGYFDHAMPSIAIPVRGYHGDSRTRLAFISEEALDFLYLFSNIGVCSYAEALRGFRDMGYAEYGPGDRHKIDRILFEIKETLLKFGMSLEAIISGVDHDQFTGSDVFELEVITDSKSHKTAQIAK